MNRADVIAFPYDRDRRFTRSLRDQRAGDRYISSGLHNLWVTAEDGTHPTSCDD